MPKGIDIYVREYVNGEARHLWMGLQECAWHHHIHPLRLKELIMTGFPLNPREREEITFDVDVDSPYDLIEDGRGGYIAVPVREHPDNGEV